jgi:hypothetical protein
LPLLSDFFFLFGWERERIFFGRGVVILVEF